MLGWDVKKRNQFSGPKGTFTDCFQSFILSCLQLCIDICRMFIFLKRNLNLNLAFDLWIFYFVSKSDCNISMIVFQTTVKLCSKIEIIFSSQIKLTWVQKNMTEGAKNNYALVIKLDLTFLSLVLIFEVFCRLLNSRRRLGKTDKQKQHIQSERVDNHLCLRVLSMFNSKINWIPKG